MYVKILVMHSLLTLLIAITMATGVRAEDGRRIDGSDGGFHCKWSPDGKQVAFASWNSGETKMYLVPVTGGEPVLVDCGLTGDHHTGWSPDSKYLVFDAQETDGPPPRLWLIPTAGGKPQRLLPDVIPAFQPALSPDGEWVAFASLRSGSANIWKAKPNGDSLTQVTTGSGSDHHPQWSPDGRFIVFASNRSGNWDIWKVNTDAQQPVQLTFSPESDDQPMVSPDGRLIAFMSVRSGKRDIWLVSSEGGTARQFTSEGENAWPSFSPDGINLLWSSNRNGQTYVYVAEVTRD